MFYPQVKRPTQRLFHINKAFRPHGLVFALICIVSCDTLYRQVCAFPNHVQSIEFTTSEHKV